MVGEVQRQFGRIDVLVNNAGWDKVEPFLDNDPAVWERLIAINLRAPCNLQARSARHGRTRETAG